MNYWLMKSEPSEFGIDDLQNMPDQTEHWDGVRNYQARNMMRDQMKVGDQVFFYHSNCKEPGIVGIMEVVKEGYPDFTAFDPDDKHFDPKSNPENPRWFMVDVKFVRKLHNLANVNTVGFKKARADYQDLLYQEVKSAGASSSPSTIVPTGLYVGEGVRTVSTQKIFTQGNLEQTDNTLDLAIEGEGFFQVLKPDGTVAYTRAGEFKVDSEGRIVTADGYTVEPQITIPSDAMTINISSDGIVSVTQPGSSTPTEVGSFELARFINPAGLRPDGKNLFTATSASGDAVTAAPGSDGLGTLAQGFLEMSNVSVVEEMVNMIVAQRSYEINSKAIHRGHSCCQLFS